MKIYSVSDRAGKSNTLFFGERQVLLYDSAGRPLELSKPLIDIASNAVSDFKKNPKPSEEKPVDASVILRTKAEVKRQRRIFSDKHREALNDSAIKEQLVELIRRTHQDEAMSIIRKWMKEEPPKSSGKVIGISPPNFLDPLIKIVFYVKKRIF